MVVLLGDIFDFWFSYREVVPRGHVRLLGKLADLTDSGIAVHYFIGNHDMWLFDYLEKEIGIVMHQDPEYMDFDGKRFLIGHGDGLGHIDKHYDLLKRIFRSRFNQWLFRLLPSSFTFGIAHRWSNHSRGSHNPEELCYLGDDREGIVRHCKEELRKGNIDFCVFGHRHTAVMREIEIATNDGNRKSTYVNVGNWIDARNYAVYCDGKIMICEL